MLTQEIINTLDPGIRDLVLQLNSDGIETMTSCQGGENHSFSIATIGFETINDKDKHWNKVRQIDNWMQNYVFETDNKYYYILAEIVCYEALCEEFKGELKLKANKDKTFYVIYLYLSKNRKEIEKQLKKLELKENKHIVPISICLWNGQKDE